VKVIGQACVREYCDLMDRVIEKEGPLFWQGLQEKLAMATDCLPDEFTGSITSFAGGVRVTVNELGKAFNQAYTDLFYKRGSSEIRCSTLNGSPYTLKFSMSPDNKVTVKTTLGLDSMDVDQTTEYIMQLMLDTMRDR
jgi:hypothetical protein